MLDFIDAVANELFGNHPRRHVSADAQAALVRFLHDHRHQFGFDGAINFDLDIPEVRVTIHTLAGFFRSSCKNFDGTLVWAGTVDEPSSNDPRANLGSTIYFMAQLGQIIDRISQVANRGDSGGYVEKCS